MERNSVNVRTSRYVAGGVTEVNSKALEWWERTVFDVLSDDQLYVIEDKFAGRLDQISALFYGESNLWWFIAQYNAILDPHSEIIAGRILRIPSKSKVDAMLTGNIGGVQSTRETSETFILPLV